MPRVPDLCVDQQGIVVNAVPINMVLPTKEPRKKKSKKTSSKKRKNPKKVKSSSSMSSPTKETNTDESNEQEPTPSENQKEDIEPEGTNVKTSAQSLKESNPETTKTISSPTNTTPPSETTSNIFSKPTEEDPILDQTIPSEEVPTPDVGPHVPTSGHNQTHEQEKVQDQTQEVLEDEDEVPLAKILQGMKKGNQPLQSTEEESSEESEGIRISIPVKGKAKTYRSKQVETPVTTKKGKRKAEKKASGEKSSKKKQVIAISDSDTDVEADVLDIMTSGKKRVGGRRIPANIPPAPMDTVSFHSEESAQKWRFVYQRRVAQERELSQEALECKEIIELLEKAELMKTVKDLGNCYEKLVKEFIVNITTDCSEEVKM